MTRVWIFERNKGGSVGLFVWWSSSGTIGVGHGNSRRRKGDSSWLGGGASVNGTRKKSDLELETVLERSIGGTEGLESGATT